MLRAIFLCKQPTGKERGNYCLLIGKLVASRSNICQLRGVEVRQGIKVSQECMLSVVMQRSDPWIAVDVVIKNGKNNSNPFTVGWTIPAVAGTGQSAKWTKPKTELNSYVAPSDTQMKHPDSIHSEWSFPLRSHSEEPPVFDTHNLHTFLSYQE